MSFSSTDATIGESDEDFARRLQAEEMGITLVASSRQHSVLQNNSGLSRSPQTAVSPLMNGPDHPEETNNDENVIERDENGNPTVIGSRINELATSRTTMNLLIAMTVPQVVAALVILPMHWNDKKVCSQENHDKWNWWAVLSTLRMFMYMVVVITMHYYRDWIIENRHIVQANNIRNMVDAAGFVWFLVGNVWVFSDEVDCSNAGKSPVYNLCLWMLIINYVQICLPCIIAMCLIPFFCFCMPCLIRVLARLQNAQNAPKGATDTLINTLPVQTISECLNEGEKTCPVCLNDMDIGDQVRNLPCKHLFHKDCVDEWLRVNASCPTCRTSIIGNDDTSTHNSGNNIVNDNDDNIGDSNHSNIAVATTTAATAANSDVFITSDDGSCHSTDVFIPEDSNNNEYNSTINNCSHRSNDIEMNRNVRVERMGMQSTDSRGSSSTDEVHIAETPISNGRIHGNRYRLL